MTNLSNIFSTVDPNIEYNIDAVQLSLPDSWDFPDNSWNADNVQPYTIDGLESMLLSKGDSSSTVSNEGFIVSTGEIPENATTLKLKLYGRTYSGSDSSSVSPSGNVIIDVSEKHLGDNIGLTDEATISSGNIWNFSADDSYKKLIISIDLSDSSAGLSVGDSMFLCISRNRDDSSETLNDGICVTRMESWFE